MLKHFSNKRNYQQTYHGKIKMQLLCRSLYYNKAKEKNSVLLMKKYFCVLLVAVDTTR